MMLKSCRVLIVADFILGAADVAHAGMGEDCVSNISARIISGCTRIIKSKKNGRNGIASAYLNRGNTYRKAGKYDRAVQDWEQAMQLIGRPQVELVQKLLKKDGFYKGVINGDYDARTRKGLIACSRKSKCLGF